MKNKNGTNIIKDVILFGIIFLLAGICINEILPSDGVTKVQGRTTAGVIDLEEVRTPAILSPKDIQRQLVEMGYDIGPDGVDGNIGTDTKLAWDKAICNQYAIEDMEKMK